MLTLGLAFRVLMVIYFGELAADPIRLFLDLVHEYQLPATGLLVVGVLLYQWRKIRKRRA